MIAWLYRIVLLITLWYGHQFCQKTTVSIGTNQTKGIAPVSDAIMPLSADDIARGLLAEPSIQISKQRLQQTYEVRYILSQQHNELRRLRHEQRQAAILLINTMEDTNE